MKWRAMIALMGLLIFGAPCQAEWVQLMNGKDLTGWQVIGDGVWTVMNDGTLLGQRVPGKSQQQAWLYTEKEYGEFDLEMEYWTRLGGNSGISIRDTSRARYAVPPDYDRTRTPSHIGYEIQIINGYRETYPTGSVYSFVKAAPDAHILNDWNRIAIESRNEMIHVRVNGKLVCEFAGDPARSKTGPIGLQLHDPQSIAMFRNIRLREHVRR